MLSLTQFRWNKNLYALYERIELMRKAKAAAMIFGSLTTCMAGVLLAGYVVSPTVGVAASREVSAVKDCPVSLENTEITDSNEKEKKTDTAAVQLAYDGGYNVENIEKTETPSEQKNTGEYKFAVTNIQPASYEEPVFVAAPQESSVNIYSQYRGETPAVEFAETQPVPAEDYREAFSYINTEKSAESETGEEDNREVFEFTIEEVTEPETEEVTEPETTEEVTEPVTEETEEETTEPETEEITESAAEEPSEPETEEVTEPEETTVSSTEYEDTPTVTTQYVAEPAEPETTQPEENRQETQSNPVIPLTDSEYIALCNAVAHEAGCNWISTRDKANVVEVIMNRVYSSLFPNSVIEVLTQQNQFTGAESYAYLGYFTSDVSQDVIDAVNLYFSDPSSFSEGYFYFYGDGYQNHFSQGGWW